jgi:hypothetical protein
MWTQGECDARTQARVCLQPDDRPNESEWMTRFPDYRTTNEPILVNLFNEYKLYNDQPLLVNAAQDTPPAKVVDVVSSKPVVEPTKSAIVNAPHSSFSDEDMFGPKTRAHTGDLHASHTS